ncbi:MAG: PAS domain-containing protein [Proteobacteria bacterium]|nr:PAS domain-containing protein [Pseudomonadota bacterium]
MLESRTTFRDALVETWNRLSVESDEVPAEIREAKTLQEWLPSQTFEACILPVVAQSEIHHEIWAQLEEAGFTITYLFHLTLERPGLDPAGNAATTTVTRQVVPYLCRTRFGCHQRVLSILTRVDPVVSEIVPASTESPHERYRKLLNRLTEGFWDIGPDLTIAYANATFKKILGDPKAIGKSLLDYFEPADQARLLSILRKQQEGIIIPFTMQLKPRDGNPEGAIIQIDPSPRFGWSGQYLGGWALVREVSRSSPDVSEALRHERELYALYTVASTLTRGFRLDALVRAATECIREQLGVDATCTWVRTGSADGSCGSLTLVAPHGIDGAPLSDDLLENALAWCEETPESKPANVLRSTARSRNPLARVMCESDCRSVAGIPLVAGTTRIGHLFLACRDPAVMTRNWVSLMISVSHQLAVAVVNALGVEERLREEKRQKQFYRDAVCAITNGKLQLIDRSELTRVMDGGRELAALTINAREDIQAARALTESTLAAQGFTEERIFDIATCVSEAATNTLLHGGGGIFRISDVPPGHREGARLSLEDKGNGINFSELPQAILKRGYSTAVSMGLGYTLILDMMDAVFLATDANGTSLVMEAALHPVNAELEAWLAKVGD